LPGYGDSWTVECHTGDESVTEIVFLVEEDSEGGYTARALGESIFTEAETWDELENAVRDAVVCHFDDEQDRPKVLRLHYVRDKVLAL
jgi:hypothetical protein